MEELISRILTLRGPRGPLWAARCRREGFKISFDIAKSLNEHI